MKKNQHRIFNTCNISNFTVSFMVLSSQEVKVAGVCELSMPEEIFKTNKFFIKTQMLVTEWNKQEKQNPIQINTGYEITKSSIKVDFNEKFAVKDKMTTQINVSLTGIVLFTEDKQYSLSIWDTVGDTVKAKQYSRIVRVKNDIQNGIRYCIYCHHNIPLICRFIFAAKFYECDENAENSKKMLEDERIVGYDSKYIADLLNSRPKIEQLNNFEGDHWELWMSDYNDQACFELEIIITKEQREQFLKTGKTGKSKLLETLKQYQEKLKNQIKVLGNYKDEEYNIFFYDPKDNMFIDDEDDFVSDLWSVLNEEYSGRKRYIHTHFLSYAKRQTKSVGTSETESDKQTKAPSDEIVNTDEEKMFDMFMNTLFVDAIQMDDLSKIKKKKTHTNHPPSQQTEENNEVNDTSIKHPNLAENSSINDDTPKIKKAEKIMHSLTQNSSMHICYCFCLFTQLVASAIFKTSTFLIIFTYGGVFVIMVILGLMTQKATPFFGYLLAFVIVILLYVIWHHSSHLENFM